MGLFGKVKAWLPTAPGGEPQPRELETEPEQRELTDEGRVLRVLVSHDGQVSKSTLLTELEWDETKADAVLDGMDQANEVRIVPHGSDVLICRPGFEPAGHQKI